MKLDARRRSTFLTLDLFINDRRKLPPIPFELTSYLSDKEWDRRMTCLVGMLGHYCRPLLERCYVLLVMLATITLPIVLYAVIYNAASQDDNAEADAFAARFVGLSVFLLVGLLLWTPLLIWKSIGSRRVKKLLASWEESDRARLNCPIPKMQVKPPGLFRSSIRIRITTPPQSRPATTFHPDAYYPNFMNGSVSPRAYFYPYMKREAGLPHMSVVGAAYTGKESATYFENLDLDEDQDYKVAPGEV